MVCGVKSSLKSAHYPDIALGFLFVYLGARMKGLLGAALAVLGGALALRGAKASAVQSNP